MPTGAQVLALLQPGVNTVLAAVSPLVVVSVHGKPN